MSESQDFSHSQQHKQASSRPVGVKGATYTCPVCNEQILVINGETLSYLSSHVAATQDDNGMTTLTMQHPQSQIQEPSQHRRDIPSYNPGPFKTGSYNPGPVNRPPFFVVESMLIEAFGPTDK